MILNKLFIAGICMLSLAACNKEVSELPEATQTGADTFGAKVDGAMWVPRGFGPFPANNILQVRYNTFTKGLVINARNYASSPNETEFEILLNDVNGPGTYIMNSNITSFPSNDNYGYYIKRTVTPKDEWVTSVANTGSVTITKLDLVENIVSGTFAFSAESLNGFSVPISVTEGRFDIRIR